MTTLNIRIRALEHNIEIIKSLAADAQIIAVLKGNAYGLGLCKFATFLQARGIRHFAVTELADAIELREKGIFGEILLLTPLYHPEDITRAIKHDITLSITSVSCGQILEDTAARLNHFCAHAHLCIDTGFGRYGFLCSKTSQIGDIINTVHAMTHVQVTGIYSHFYAACCKNERFVKKQFEDFNNLCTTLTDAGIPLGIRHISSSSSLVRFPYMNLDAVRIGSAFLGRLAVSNSCGFENVCDLTASVDDVYELPAGHNIGYGKTCRLTKASTTAVVSAGYFHGLGMTREAAPKHPSPLRLLRLCKHACFQKKQTAEFEGQTLPVLGQISMNSCILNVSKAPVSIGDSVTFRINPLFVNSAVPRVYC